MKAMVFAAGLGTRLQPLTLHRPKALVEVGGIPMLARVLLRLRSIGVNEVVINVHHLAPMIVDYLKANDDFGMTVYISDESDRLLDTGGGILRARRWLEGSEPFIVHNADVLTDADIASMYRQHVATGADATLLVSERHSSRQLVFDKVTDRLVGWVNNSTGETLPDGFDVSLSSLRRLAFGGVHIISPSVFASLAKYGDEVGDKFSITPYYLSVCDTIDIRGYIDSRSSMWYDIGRTATLAAADDECRRRGI
ncbi:MAG: nucleotidyltransferase family protein [Muribaculaceae bacterium]|nr:nucleotidyltransferase family protein [Muribaculaceae bacterium]